MLQVLFGVLGVQFSHDLGHAIAAKLHNVKVNTTPFPPPPHVTTRLSHLINTHPLTLSMSRPSLPPPPPGLSDLHPVLPAVPADRLVRIHHQLSVLS